MSVAYITQKLHIVIFFIISSVIIYQAASITWLVLLSDKSSFVWNLPKKKVVNNSLKPSLAISSQHLFGVAKSANSKQIKAPLTNLNLKLVGIVAASKPSESSAIIDQGGGQQSYFVGSKINGTSATVSSIYLDRLIIDVNGVVQTLLFDKDLVDHSSANNASEARRTVHLNRKEILKDPSKITDLIKINPVSKNKRIIGYRLTPGRNKKAFDEAGLISGDLAIRLNGVDLTNPREAFSLMGAFPTMHNMTLTIKRSGKLHDLYLSLPE